MLPLSALLNPVPEAPVSEAHCSSSQDDPPVPSQYNIRISKKIRLDILHTHRASTLLEYPDTSATGWVGHLFEMDAAAWHNPALNFAYSQGAPRGRTKSGEEHHCSLLVDSLSGETVPCSVSHSTCMSTTSEAIITKAVF